jgi:orotidine-5'-phosphate decarboxylase
MELSFSERARRYWPREKCKASWVAHELLLLMERKHTNLCFSVDLTQSRQILTMARLLGPHICVLKTHVDIIDDFSWDFVQELSRIAAEFDFMIFEDRKFADIGSTVQKQYGGGIYGIAKWAHITNCHVVPGPGIIDGLKSVGQNVAGSLEEGKYLDGSRALLLLAEMSSEGSLACGDYTQKCCEMAFKHRDFVIGFVGSRRFVNAQADHDFLSFTPGVQLEVAKDSLGQQYRTPEVVITQNGTDIVIVGRGIYKDATELQMVERAKTYKKRCWDAYLARLAK